jgi:hypothetical protein
MEEKKMITKEDNGRKENDNKRGQWSQPWPWAHNESKGLQKCRPIMKLESHISCSWECGRNRE